MSEVDSLPVRLAVRHEVLAPHDPRLTAWMASRAGAMDLARWIECWYQLEIDGGAECGRVSEAVRLEVLNGAERDPVWARGLHWDAGLMRRGLTAAGPTGPIPVQAGSKLTFRVLSDRAVIASRDLEVIDTPGPAEVKEPGEPGGPSRGIAV